MKNKFSTDLLWKRRKKKINDERKKLEKETSFIQYVETFEISFLINIDFLSYDISRIFFYKIILFLQ